MKTKQNCHVLRDRVRLRQPEDRGVLAANEAVVPPYLLPKIAALVSKELIPRIRVETNERAGYPPQFSAPEQPVPSEVLWHVVQEQQIAADIRGFQDFGTDELSRLGPVRRVTNRTKLVGSAMTQKSDLAKEIPGAVQRHDDVRRTLVVNQDQRRSTRTVVP
jgi:hypothetical protein